MEPHGLQGLLDQRISLESPPTQNKRKISLREKSCSLFNKTAHIQPLIESMNSFSILDLKLVNRSVALVTFQEFQIEPDPQDPEPICEGA